MARTILQRKSSFLQEGKDRLRSYISIPGLHSPLKHALPTPPATPPLENTTTADSLFKVFQSLAYDNLFTIDSLASFAEFLTTCSQYQCPEHSCNGFPITLGWFPDNTRCEVMVGGPTTEAFWKERRNCIAPVIRTVTIDFGRQPRQRLNLEKSPKSSSFSHATCQTKEHKEQLRLPLLRLGPVYTAPYEAFLHLYTGEIWLLSDVKTNKFVHHGRLEKKAHKGRSIAAVRLLNSVSQVQAEFQQEIVPLHRRTIVGCRASDDETGQVRVRAKTRYGKWRVDSEFKDELPPAVKKETFAQGRRGSFVELPVGWEEHYYRQTR